MKNSTLQLFTWTLLAVSTSNYCMGNDINSVAADLVNNYLQKEHNFLQVSYGSPDDDMNDSGWSLQYDWKKDMPLSTDINEDNYATFKRTSFNAYANGSYAFSDKFNHEELSKAGFTLHYDVVSRPKLSINDRLDHETSLLKQKCVLENSDKGDPVAFCDQKMGLFLDNENDFSHAWFVDANAYLEGNQDFSRRQYVYGIAAGYNFAPPPDHWTGWLNPLDWPLFVTRQLTGYSNSYSHRLPTFVLGAERIDPTDDQERKDAGDEDHYQRLSGEISYAAPLGLYKGHKIKFNFSYRYFREIDPSSQIKSANLDRFKYAAYAIQIPSKAFNLGNNDEQQIIISYSTGRLPFTDESDKVIEIGWKSNVDFQKLLGSALGFN